MKYINKNIKNEPEILREYRNTTPNASYEKGFGDDLKKALLVEQGCICAYCMKRISLERKNGKPKIEVEHYKSQENFPDKDLDYNNMLGVCNGSSGKIEHCDKSRNYTKNGETHSLELKRLNPLQKINSEDLITYTAFGKIKSKFKNSDIEYDIGILNLNNENLREQRETVLKTAIEKFKDKYPQKKDKKWTIRMFNNEIEKYKTLKKGKYTPFCQIIIWHFEKLKTKPKYQ